MAIKHPWTNRNETEPYLATFTDDDERYAEVRGVIYPVLLSSCRAGAAYEEDLSDDDDFPVEWCNEFGRDLLKRSTAILVSDESSNSWKFLGLFKVRDVRISNFLTCRLGKKIAPLRLG